MSKFIGRLVDVGIGKETTRGTGVSAAKTIPKSNISFEAKANIVKAGEGLGNIAGEGSQSVVTGQFTEGAIEGEINVNSFGLLMLAVFGSESVATVSGAQKHTYTLTNSNQHTSLSIHMQDPIGDLQAMGCMVDQLEITIQPNEIAKFTCSFKGRKIKDGTFTPSYAVDYKFVGRDSVIKVAADTSSLAAASALSIKEIKIVIAKNTDYDWVLGSIEPEDVLNKAFVISGSITLNYEDRTWRNYMLNGTKRALGILLQNTRETIGTNNPALYFEFPAVDFSEWESQRGNEEIAGQTINFTALYDIATSKLISDCYVINSSNAY